MALVPPQGLMGLFHARVELQLVYHRVNQWHWPAAQIQRVYNAPEGTGWHFLKLLPLQCQWDW
jgi:hypothetical protein